MNTSVHLAFCTQKKEEKKKKKENTPSQFQHFSDNRASSVLLLSENALNYFIMRRMKKDLPATTEPHLTFLSTDTKCCRTPHFEDTHCD